MKSTPTKILIADYIPAFNKGELAILEGIVESFEVLDKVDVSIFSFNTRLDSTRYPESVRLIDVKRELSLLESYQGFQDFHKANIVNGLLGGFRHIVFGFLYSILKENSLKLMRSGLWREYCNTDVIITSHDQESCLFGPPRLPLLPLYATLLAKTLHKSIVIYGNGTYKFRRKIWEKLAGYLLDNVDLVTTRERETYDYFRRLATRKSHIFLTADPAFLLRPVNRENALQILQEEGVAFGKKLLIGVTITDGNLSFGTRIRGNPSERQKPIVAFAGLIDRLIEEFDATIVFLPHCIGPSDFLDDRLLAKKLYSLVRNKQNVFVITKELSTRELKGIIGVLNLLIGGRVHSVISAFSLGVPTIILTGPMDTRVGIAGGIAGQEQWIYEMKEPNLDGLLLKIETLISVRHEVSEDLHRRSQIARRLARKNGELLKALLEAKK